MNPMTNQEIFNRVWEHFITNGNPRAYNVGMKKCLYKDHANGAKCAIGIFIPEDKFNPEMNNVGAVSSLNVDYPKLLNEMFGELPTRKEEDDRMEFLESLQDAHDLSNSAEEFKDFLLQTAETFYLEAPQ